MMSRAHYAWSMARTAAPATIPRVRDYLRILPIAPRPCPSVARIQAAVCAHYGLRHMDMVTARRARAVAWPRQVAMYLCRELTARSLPEIGKHFGGRDHSTVIHALRRVEQRSAADPTLASDLATLRASLSGGML